MAYLDKAGLTELWKKKSYVDAQWRGTRQRLQEMQETATNSRQHGQ